MRKNIIKIMSMIAIGTLTLTCGVASAETTTSTSTPASTTTSTQPKRSILGVGIVINDSAVYCGYKEDAFQYWLHDKTSEKIVLPTSYTYRKVSYPITKVSGISQWYKASEVIVPNCYENFELHANPNLKKVVIENDSTYIRFLQELQEAQVYVEHKGHDEVTVTYLNLDGTVKALEVVDRGSSAKYAGVIEKPFFTFTGWTGADLTKVTENVTVKPVIELTKTETAGTLCLANDNVLAHEDIYDHTYNVVAKFENVTGTLDYKVVITSDKGMHATFTKHFLETESWQLTQIVFPLINDVYDVCVIATDSSEVTYEKHMSFKPSGNVRDAENNYQDLEDYSIEPFNDNLVVGDKIYFNASYSGEVKRIASVLAFDHPTEISPIWDEEKQMYCIEFTEEGFFMIRFGNTIVASVDVIKETPTVVEPVVETPELPPTVVDQPTTPTETVVDQPETPTETEVAQPSASPSTSTETVVEQPSVSPSTSTVVEVAPATTGDSKGVVILVTLMTLSVVGLKIKASK